MKKLLNSYVGNQISVTSTAKNVKGTLMFVGDDYIVIQTSPEVIDVVKMDKIVSLEGLKYETFLAAIGRNRVAVNNDINARLASRS